MRSTAIPGIDTNTAKVKPSPLGTGGRIIFVSATLHYRTQPFQTHVSVAKAGVDALSHSVSIEFGPQGVTSNIVAPGPIAGTEVSFSRRLRKSLRAKADLDRAWSVSSPQTFTSRTSSLSRWDGLVLSVTSRTRPCISSLIAEAMSTARR